MLLDTILNLWDMISDGMQEVYDIMTSSLRDLLTVDVPIIQSVIDFIVNNLGIGDWNVLDLMFGVGLPFIVIFAITKWLIDIIP